MNSPYSSIRNPVSGHRRRMREDPCHKRDGALELLPAREEGDGFLEPDYEGEANEEEDLANISAIFGVTGWHD